MPAGDAGGAARDMFSTNQWRERHGATTLEVRLMLRAFGIHEEALVKRILRAVLPFAIPHPLSRSACSRSWSAHPTPLRTSTPPPPQFLACVVADGAGHPWTPAAQMGEDQLTRSESGLWADCFVRFISFPFVAFVADKKETRKKMVSGPTGAVAKR